MGNGEREREGKRKKNHKNISIKTAACVSAVEAERPGIIPNSAVAFREIWGDCAQSRKRDFFAIRKPAFFGEANTVDCEVFFPLAIAMIASQQTWELAASH